MAERILHIPQHRTDKGQLVVPLADMRTYDHQTTTVVSGIDATIYTIQSGKEAYIRRCYFSELSGQNAVVQLLDMAGSGLSPRIPVAGNSVVSYDPCPCALGPVISGIYMDEPPFQGDVTILVTIDPKKTE